MTGLTAGKLAAEGADVETVRFCHRRGLLALPEGQGPGYRECSEADRRRLAFIVRAGRPGFMLAVGPDQVGVVRVDAVGDDADLDPGAVRDLVRGGNVHHFARLGLNDRLGRVARADLLRWVAGSVAVTAESPAREDRARSAAERGELPLRPRNVKA